MELNYNDIIESELSKYFESNSFKAVTKPIYSELVMIQSKDKTGYCLPNQGRQPSGLKRETIKNPNNFILEKNIIYEVNEDFEIVGMLGKQEVGPVSKPFVANSTVINSLTKVETEKTTNDKDRKSVV